ncbi:phenylacetate--CoA ligase [Solihabitans fulvus]|uniref:Phenylacetate--CoA ligase n=1 Tax=Solihabitans fulvus TaxID=1892852 RepID=A0A5B2XIX6_9PSEU|nr:phenylacetate--CoA ligase [Solihabitans fulvus]KAA2263363.1 phenylacetate--CoA ligase [Solihabitans fulvus]
MSNAERDNRLLLWEHEGLDVERVAELPADERTTVLWEHSTKHLYSRNPHYAELLHAAGDPSWRDLGAVPTFDQTLDWAGGGLLVDEYRSDALYFSGGTTDRHKVLHSDLREDAYLNAVRALQYAKTPRPYRAIALRPIDVTHGAPAPIPELHRHATIALPLVSEQDYEEAAHLLLDNGSSNDAQRLISVRSQTPTILGLTFFLAERKVDTARIAVESVLHGGFHLSASDRRKVRDFWQCDIVDMYGCTEFYQSYGMRCRHCAAYHFNWTILVEVTDRNGQRVDEGIGELTLTHLAPFSLRQPLLRYRTGDLVEIDGVCDATGRDRYLFGGRLRDAVRLTPESAAVERGIERHYLTPLQLKDAVDPLPFVHHERDLQHEKGIYLAEDSSTPTMDWEATTGADGVLRIDVLIGLHSRHRDRPVDHEHFESLARKEILATSGPLAELVAAGRAMLTCSMVAPEILDATARAV